MNIWLPLFWSTCTWSLARGLGPATRAGLEHWQWPELLCSLGEKVHDQAWPSSALELSKIMKKSGPICWFFNPHLPDWVNTPYYWVIFRWYRSLPAVLCSGRIFCQFWGRKFLFSNKFYLGSKIFCYSCVNTIQFQLWGSNSTWNGDDIANKVTKFCYAIQTRFKH